MTIASPSADTEPTDVPPRGPEEEPQRESLAVPGNRADSAGGAAAEKPARGQEKAFSRRASGDGSLGRDEGQRGLEARRGERTRLLRGGDPSDSTLVSSAPTCTPHAVGARRPRGRGGCRPRAAKGAPGDSPRGLTPHRSPLSARVQESSPGCVPGRAPLPQAGREHRVGTGPGFRVRPGGGAVSLLPLLQTPQTQCGGGGEEGKGQRLRLHTDGTAPGGTGDAGHTACPSQPGRGTMPPPGQPLPWLCIPGSFLLPKLGPHCQHSVTCHLVYVTTCQGTQGCLLSKQIQHLQFYH